MGGIKSVYLANYENVTGVVSSSGVISSIAKANNGRFYLFNLTRGTSSATEEFNDDIATRNQVAILAQATLVAVIEDRNGKYWYYGKESGLMRAGGSAATGTAGGDRNGYEVILTGEEREMALEVNSSVIATLTV